MDSVAKEDLEFLILLPPLSKCLDYWCTTVRPGFIMVVWFLFFLSRVSGLDWPRTPFIAKDNFELLILCLYLLSAGIASVHPYAQWFF